MLNRVNLGQLDLNLLPKFRALYLRRSVSAAARDLYLTQPAISNALAKMREVFGDDLFVRTPEGMSPTPLAHALWAAISPALEMLEALDRAGEFRPETSTREFSFVASATAECSVLPRVYSHIRAEAPLMSLSTIAAEPATVTARLRNREADFAIGDFEDLGDEYNSMLLTTTSYAGIARSGHPALAPESSLQLRDCEFIEALDCGSRVGRSDEIPKRCTRAANLSSIPFLVAMTDLVAVVPDRMAVRFAVPLDLTIVDDPFNRPPSPNNLYWDRRRESDPGIRWIVDAVADVTEAGHFGEAAA